MRSLTVLLAGVVGVGLTVGAATVGSVGSEMSEPAKAVSSVLVMNKKRQPRPQSATYRIRADEKVVVEVRERSEAVQVK